MIPSTHRLNDLLALSHVPRWAIVSTIRDQTVADHSYRTTIIAMELIARLNMVSPLLCCEVMWWALVHDGAESHTGDITGRIKAEHMGFKEMLTAVEHRECLWLDDASPTSPTTAAIVKVADLIEAVTWLWMNKHGSHAEQVWRWLTSRLYDAGTKLAEAIDRDHGVVQEMVRLMVNEIQCELERSA